MQGTRAIGESDKFGKGGSTLRRKALAIGLLAAVAVSATAFGFDAYFSDASGNKIQGIWEGSRFYVVVNDPEKGACGIDEFTADLVIFDFKTGAYIEKQGAIFREFTAGSGLYFWSDGTNKLSPKVGDRVDWTDVEKMEHRLDTEGVTYDGAGWEDGNWIYVDENVDAPNFDGKVDTLPGEGGSAGSKQAWRAQAVIENEITEEKPGRFENMDTLVLIVADETDERNIDQDQVKIIDTVATLTVNPSALEYGCGTVCANITVTINDPDENLDCDKIDYVPFFVIINPGSWNPQTSSVTNFCSLKMYGGYGSETATEDLNQPIRWYNVYDERWIDYSLSLIHI